MRNGKKAKHQCTKNEGSKILGYTLPFFVILSIWLLFFSPMVTSTMYAAHLQQVITKSTPPKTANSSAFLTYENNSTLGIKILYPANWQKDNYNNKVAFYAPPLDNSKIIPVAMFVDVDTL